MNARSNVKQMNMSIDEVVVHHRMQLNRDQRKKLSDSLDALKRSILGIKPLKFEVPIECTGIVLISVSIKPKAVNDVIRILLEYLDKKEWIQGVSAIANILCLDIKQRDAPGHWLFSSVEKVIFDTEKRVILMEKFPGHLKPIQEALYQVRKELQKIKFPIEDAKNHLSYLDFYKAVMALKNGKLVNFYSFHDKDNYNEE